MMRWDLVNKWVRERGYKVGVGVGVHLGIMFRQVLMLCPEDFEWIGVDLFEPRPGLEALGGESYVTEDLPGSYQRLLSDLMPPDPDPTFRARGHLIKGESTRVAQQFSDGSLDLVFIDADHREEAVLADIAAWRPKVRPGGTLSGHDCEVVPQHSHCAGVIRAVNAACPGWVAHTDDNVWELRV